MTGEEIRRRIDAVEESYEFFLAYAAQGVRDDRESPLGGELRRFLGRTIEALSGLADGLRALARAGELGPAGAYQQLAGVLARDAESALAALELVSAQAGVSSQLVDNLNASIHLRAVLTDLFLLDELLKPAEADAPSPGQPGGGAGQPPQSAVPSRLARKPAP